MREGNNRLRIGKLRCKGWNQMQQAIPCGLAFCEPKLLGHCFGSGNSSACHAVVEVQQPYPSSIKNMMHRCILDGVGWAIWYGSGAVLDRSLDTTKVTVERLGCRI